MSYKQIINAVNEIASNNISNSELASRQLELLNGTKALGRKNYDYFLSFLNALMFGIEASGINTALVTGLMTLELIKNKHFSYKQAFYENKQGGFYPYACIPTNNKTNNGTYTYRRDLLRGSRSDLVRSEPSKSPVFIKEARLINFWLNRKKLNTQKKRQEIIEEIKNLVSKLFCSSFTLTG